MSLGLVFEAMHLDLRDYVLGNVHPPVSEMWSGPGAGASRNEMRAVRSGAWYGKAPGASVGLGGLHDDDAIHLDGARYLDHDGAVHEGNVLPA